MKTLCPTHHLFYMGNECPLCRQERIERYSQRFCNHMEMKPEVKNQILKFTPVGRSLWGALYKQASLAYDEIVADIKEDKDIKEYIESHPKKVSKIVAKHVNLDKEEFEAQYAYTILNNKQNTIILL